MKTSLIVPIFFYFWILLPVASFPQSILFDFNNAPVYRPFPISISEGGITANFSATGQGYSIQSVSTATVVPVGFTGNFIFPSSIYQSDLLVSFDQLLRDFSIWYAPQELACDTSATMQVRAYKDGNYIGANTQIATTPGTWPVDTLSCHFADGFNSVVVHFLSHPSLCQDWGPIFLADNMRVTALNPAEIENHENKTVDFKISNPFADQLIISHLNNLSITFSLFDSFGRQVMWQIITGNTTTSTVQLPVGIYWYELRDPRNMLLEKGKVIKQ